MPILINVGHAADQQDVLLPGFIAGNLKKHQLDGIRFMWKNIVIPENTLPSQHGCVLAHSMGLGKTLQTISFIYTLLNELHRMNPDFSKSTFASRRILILCPPTVQSNWTAEFWKWTAIRQQSRKVLTQVINYGLMRTKEMQHSALSSWHSHGGILIMGYSGFRELMQFVTEPPRDLTTAGFGVDADESERRRMELRKYMLEDGPCLIVADEGHNIKNPKTKLASLANMLPSNSRICLTGYPLQNNLEEYWTMVDFCFPGYLGDLTDFRNNYVNPIKNGLYIDSTPMDKRFSTLRMRTLQKLLETIVARLDSSVLHRQLPRKVEYIISCPLTQLQMELYTKYLANFLNILSEQTDRNSGLKLSSNHGLFEHGVRLMYICNHPSIYKDAIEEQHRQTPKASRKAVCTDIDDDLGDELQYEVAASSGSTPPIADDNCLKVTLMLDIIRSSISMGERVLVFSRSRLTLNYLQKIVENSGIAAPNSSPDFIMRIDGSTFVSNRQKLINRFNAPDSPCRVFFISSGTGSIGINLVAASRVILFDIGWNPLYDEQAVARVYRYGQRRRVYVYRLLTTGTWEDRLFSNNVFKVSLTRRVVDKQSMGRRISKDDMKKYFQAPPTLPR
ncbi:SNF2 family N-terminal domain-containing protein, partial [Coemansia spiralis]